MAVSSSLSRHLADAARELQHETTADETMQTAVRLAVLLVDGCEAAGISLVHGSNHIDTPAATSDAARRVDELQYEFAQGPCLDALRHQETVYCQDLENETRWGDWGRRTAEETGVRSMLCFQLFTNQNTVGALNLYSFSPDGFDGEDRDHGLAIAAHAAVAVAAARELDQIKSAVEGRTVIGQAQGIVMERYGINASQAFDLLARVSSQTNTKLREVAQGLIETRHVPGTV